MPSRIVHSVRTSLRLRNGGWPNALHPGYAGGGTDPLSQTAVPPLHFIRLPQVAGTPTFNNSYLFRSRFPWQFKVACEHDASARVPVDRLLAVNLAAYPLNISALWQERSVTLGITIYPTVFHPCDASSVRFSPGSNRWSFRLQPAQTLPLKRRRVLGLPSKKTPVTMPATRTLPRNAPPRG